MLINYYVYETIFARKPRQRPFPQFPFRSNTFTITRWKIVLLSMYCRMWLAAKVILSVTSAPSHVCHITFHIDCETAQTCRLMNADWEVTNPESVSCREKKNPSHNFSSVSKSDRGSARRGSWHKLNRRCFQRALEKTHPLKRNFGEDTVSASQS